MAIELMDTVNSWERLERWRLSLDAGMIIAIIGASTLINTWFKSTYLHVLVFLKQITDQTYNHGEITHDIRNQDILHTEPNPNPIGTYRASGRMERLCARDGGWFERQGRGGSCAKVFVRTNIDRLRLKTDTYLIVNTTLKQHNRVVYSNQAIQHVARQIESLYWESVKNEALSLSQKSTGVEVGSDLSNHLYAPNLRRARRSLG